MGDVRRLPVGENNEDATPTLDGLAREGARRMIAAALEAEVGEYVASLAGEVDEDGKRLVVRNGRARERGLTVGSGTVRVRAPRVNDKRVDEETGERKRFSSRILPAYARRSGENTQLRGALDGTGIEYVLSIKPETTIFEPGTVFAVPDRRPGSRGPAPAAQRGDRAAVSVREYAKTLEPEGFQTVIFRGTGKTKVSSRFAFKRVTAAHPVTRDREAPREEWLIIEWPEGRDTPIDYWISNLPARSKPQRLARLARLRWMIELDYRQLKGELGLDHYEGRSYPGWYHHTALVTTAHAFLTLERTDPKARRRASRSHKRSAYSCPSSTAGPATATPAASR